MKIKRIAIQCGRGYIALLLIVIIGIMLMVGSQAQKETVLLAEVRARLAEGAAAEADQLLGSLASRMLGQMRTFAKYENPAVLLLAGTVKGELGAYEEALGYFERVIERCTHPRLYMLPDGCATLAAEAHFRAGNLLLLALKSGALSHFENGMMISSDDRYAKKTLEWLLALEEEMRKAGKQEREIGRGSSLFDERKFSNDPQNMRKGY